MDFKMTKAEIDNRLSKFLEAMDISCPDWNTALIVSKVNQYYFTGTMQDGILIIKKGEKPLYFVRRSLERALDESVFESIFPMESYRDAALIAGKTCGNTYMETEIAPIAIVERLEKHFDFAAVKSMDRVILSIRAVKSPYELYWMKQSGRLHNQLLTEIVPGLLYEGMSEADFASRIFGEMMNLGFQGISRFSMFQAEMVVGQIGFGENSLYPTNFDGPGGSFGMSPAAPVAGSRDRKLRVGDLVFVDTPFGVNGYQSDKTQVYLFKGEMRDSIAMEHRSCMDVQNRLASMLKPGAIPFEIYNQVMDSLSDEFKINFMGFGSRQVRFFGHGVGLHIDEFPVIANGFKAPLIENMTIALEPKKGVAGTGMVGVEDTYIVTPEGGCCITGGGRDIIRIP